MYMAENIDLHFFHFLFLSTCLPLCFFSGTFHIYWQSEKRIYQKCVNAEKNIVNTIIALSHINTNVTFNIYVRAFIHITYYWMCVCVDMKRENDSHNRQFSPV